jgi:hypothetical protein
LCFYMRPFPRSSRGRRGPSFRTRSVLNK